MAIKGIFKLLAIAILIIAILNCSYADGGPTIGENQAKHIAQDYLNSHNLPYTAITPEITDDWKIKVKDTKTGKVKWMSVDKLMEYESNAPINEITELENNPNTSTEYLSRYETFLDHKGYQYTAWVVQVNDKNGKNVGRIYVDSYTDKVLKAIIDPVSPKKESFTPTNTTNVTNTTNTTIPVSQGSSGNNTGIIFGMIILISAVGAGYFMYTRI